MKNRQVQSTPSSKDAPRWRALHQFTSPEYFYHFTGRVAPYFAFFTLITFIFGLCLALFVAPQDYQMGDSARIMYVHVPTAWLSMFVYVAMAIASAIGLIWNIKLAHYSARAMATIGAIFTACALVTGSLWGKPTWGTYWQWDARMTSELILLFLYLGYIAMHSAIEQRQLATKVAALVAIIGVVNIPIIHYSVQWWHSLHQPASISLTGKSSIHSSMLVPLLIMVLAFKLFFVSYFLHRVRLEIIINEKHKHWVKTLS